MFPSPVGGFFISSNMKYSELNKLIKQFPSPAGGFFISSWYGCDSVGWWFWFPSPAGGFFISSFTTIFVTVKQNTSFRPLPGSFLFHQ